MDEGAFTLDPTDDAHHAAEDPIHLKGKYSGSDVIQVATASYTQDKCKEQGLIDYSRQARR